MSTIVSFIGAASGLSGMVFAIISLLNNRMDAVASFLEYTKEPEFIEARIYVIMLGDYDPATIEMDRDHGHKIEYMINLYNMIGLLVRKHKFPKWFFRETSTGNSIVACYHKLEPYIIYQREKNGPRNYANQFEYLHNLINKKY